jgi:hypothetical protein
VVAATLGLEAGYGAALGHAVLYLAYELGFVVVPGWLAYRALSHRPGGPLRQLAIGWGLGYVLEILAFMLTAATGTRALFAAYPLVVGATAVAAIVRRRPAVASTSADPPLSRRFGWLLAAVCLVAVAYIGVTFFPDNALPGTHNFVYYPDYPWAISIAGDAKHHWPIQDPNISGEPFPYHYFVHIHLAAASQVTGLDLSLIFFRLFMLPLTVLLVLEFVVAGQTFARSAYAGLIAACLAFFVGEMQLDGRANPLLHIPFGGVFLTDLLVSPSFLFGLVIFIPLIILVGERITARGEAARPGDWLLVAIFIVGASDAKVAILPLVLGALLLYAGWSWLAEHRIPLAVWLAAALTLLVFGTVYLLQYQGWPSGFHVDPLAGFHFFEGSTAVVFIKEGLRDALPTFPGSGGVVSVVGILFSFLGLLGPQLVGLVWIFRHQGHRLGAGQAWLFSLLCAGLIALLFLSGARGEQGFFFFLSLVAGYVLAAEGLQIGWVNRPRLSGRTRRFAILGLAWILVLAGLMWAPQHLDLFSGLQRGPHTYLFWYGGLLLTLVLLYAVARRWIGPTRWPALALLCGAVVTVGTLDAPIGKLVPSLTDAPVPPENGKRITPELYRALTWIRNNTPADSVLAVNNQATVTGPFEFDYSAFSERRVFLEGWGYSARLRDVGYTEIATGQVNPFVARLRLNEAAFMRGDRRALRIMIDRYGVRYLVVDRINGYPADIQALDRIGRIVHQAPGVLVLELS